MAHQFNRCSVRLTQVGLGLLVLLVFAIVLFSLASYISQPYTAAAAYLNPDFLTLPYLSFNLIYEHGSIFLWHIGTAPSYLPEMLFMYLLTYFSINPFINLLIYVVFQIACIAILIPAIFKAATKSSLGMRLGIVSVFVFLATVVLKHPFNVYGMYGYLTAILAPGFHYGATIFVFALTIVFLKILDKPRAYLNIIFFILLILAGMSDPLTYVYFTFPMLVTLSIFWFFKQLSRKDYFLYMATLCVAFIIAYTAYKLIPIQYVQLNFKPSLSMILVLDFIKTVIFFIKKNFVWGILWVVFMCYAPYSIWQSFQKKEGRVQLIDYVILLQWVSVLVSTPLIILAINQIFPTSQQIFPATPFWTSPIKFYRELYFLPYRYFINFLIGPVFVGYPLLLYKHYKWIVEKLTNNYVYAIILVIFAVAIFSMKSHHFHKETFVRFQSAFTVCLKNYAKEYNLTNGISDSYAVSNLVNAYAFGTTHLALVNSNNLTEILWQNTQQVYQYHDYNYAVSNSKEMPAALKKAYGEPIHVLSCTGNNHDTYQIYVYPNGRLNNMFNH